MSQTRRIILAFIVTQLMVVAVAVYLGFAVQEYHRQRQGTQTALQLTTSASPPLSPTYTFPSTAQHQTWAAQAQTAYPISPTQYAIWTETAQPPTIDPNAPTPIPLPVWLAPSGEWTRYTHPIYGYSFEYPSNWSVSEEYIDDGVSVVNYDTSLPGPAPKDGNGVNRLRLSFGPTVSLGNQSLENFVEAYFVANPVSEILSHEGLELSNGYSVVKVKVKIFMSFEGGLIVFLTDGNSVCQFSAYDLKSRYINVADHVIESLAIP